jgi:uncharacterized protein YjbI with pentapeptide repeats
VLALTSGAVFRDGIFSDSKYDSFTIDEARLERCNLSGLLSEVTTLKNANIGRDCTVGTCDLGLMEADLPDAELGIVFEQPRRRP